MAEKLEVRSRRSEVRRSEAGTQKSEVWDQKSVRQMDPEVRSWWSIGYLNPSIFIVLLGIFIYKRFVLKIRFFQYKLNCL